MGPSMTSLLNIKSLVGRKTNDLLLALRMQDNDGFFANLRIIRIAKVNIHASFLQLNIDNYPEKLTLAKSSNKYVLNLVKHH